MKIETLKKSHLKRNIIIGVVVVGVISAIVLNFTRARYRTTQSIPLVNGTINYTPYDLNIVALYIDGVEAETLDSNTNYTLDTTQSTCTYQDGTEIPNLTLSYDSATKSFSISPYTTRGTKCTLYFEEKPLASETILAGKDIQERTDFSTPLSTNTNGIIFEEQTSDGITYYFAGDTDENWVSFAGYYWRIIRINEDGSIRMIYNGTTTDQTGTSTQIGTSAFNSVNNYSYYVGFSYDVTQHGTGTPSTILTFLNNWYDSSELSKVANSKYIDSSVGFCNDRNSASGYTWSASPNGTIRYAARTRIRENHVPSFNCSSVDLIKTKVGLITADEVMFAGGIYGTSNINYYLYTNQHYWTMSPHDYDSQGGFIFRVNANGNLYGGSNIINANGVRPVINLKADVTISSGNGTSVSPYVIAT